MPESLIDTLRQLRLPLPDNLLAEAATRAERPLRKLDADDRGRAVLNDVARWREGDEPSKLLGQVVNSALAASAGDIDPISTLAPQYFKTHADLRKNELLSFEQATAVLSHARLIAYLSDRER